MSASSQNTLRFCWLAVINFLLITSVVSNEHCRLDISQNQIESIIDLHSIIPNNQVWSANLTEPESGINFLFGICRLTKVPIPKKFLPCRLTNPICLEIPAENGTKQYVPLTRSSLRKTRLEFVNNKPTLTLENNRAMFLDEKSLNLNNSKLGICNGSKAVSIVIEYECGTMDSKLEFVSSIMKNQTCNLNFKWSNKFACPHSDRVLLTETKPNIFYDPNTKTTYDLKPFLNNETELNASYQRNNDSYSFFLNPLDSTLLELNTEACSSAFVCQIKKQTNATKKNFGRELATQGNHEVYKLSDELHLKVVSKVSKCGKFPEKNVTVIMRLLCSKSDNLTFAYESDSCDYIFNWKSPKACGFYGNQKLLEQSDDEDNEDKEVTVTPVVKSSGIKPKNDSSIKITENRIDVISKANNKPNEKTKVSLVPISSTSNELQVTTSTKSVSHVTDKLHLEDPTLMTDVPDMDTLKKNHHIGLLLLVIIFVTSIFLAILLVIDDSKRMWFVTRMRRALNSKLTPAFRYSQVPNRNLEASKLVRLENVPDY